jgi:MtN3 and saliva related transmembrane protein
MNEDLIGWAASMILFATISRQVYKQWQQGDAPGVSGWLFVGQIAASIGFLVYSLMLDNWVFVFTNAMLLVAAVIGEVGHLRARRQADRGASPDAALAQTISPPPPRNSG